MKITNLLSVVLASFLFSAAASADCPRSPTFYCNTSDPNGDNWAVYLYKSGNDWSYCYRNNTDDLQTGPVSADVTKVTYGEYSHFLFSTVNASKQNRVEALISVPEFFEDKERFRDKKNWVSKYYQFKAFLPVYERNSREEIADGWAKHNLVGCNYPDIR